MCPWQSTASTVFLLFLLLIQPHFALGLDDDGWELASQRRPWALGITVPDKSPLENGERLDWSLVKNLTVVVTIPKINHTDDTIYVIVSVMTASRTVLQVAAGLEPGETAWSTYAMYVTDVYGPNKTYHLVLYKSAPYFAHGDKISVSIYSSINGQQPVWLGDVCNLMTKKRTTFPIVADGSMNFMAGEQEVIALESYTSREEVFANMGGMILHGIIVDGRRVAGGWYVDDGMVFYRQSLFVVGGGAPVPGFISISFNENSEMVWSYSPVSWEASGGEAVYLVLLIAVLVLLVTVTAALKIS